MLIGQFWSGNPRQTGMTAKRAVSYLRVRTRNHGGGGLGTDAQREAVAALLRIGEWRLVAELVEVDSGRKHDRPELEKALAACRFVAKLNGCLGTPTFFRDWPLEGRSYALRHALSQQPNRWHYGCDGRGRSSARLYLHQRPA